MAWTRQMRVKMGGQLGPAWPETARVLIDHFENQGKEKGLESMWFHVHGLPMSLNHQYRQDLRFCKEGTPGAFQDKQGRWRVRNNRLRPEVISWREVMVECMGDLRFKWKPTGVSAAILLFESPNWLDGRRQVREKDADNLTKPTFDAVQHATEVPDELHWEFHVYKLLSKRQRTTIFLYDLGDVVEYYY